MISMGTSAQFTLKDPTSGNPIQDGVEWISVDTTILSIDSTGLAKGNKVGDSTVIASYQGTEISVKATVTAATLQKMIVTPENPIAHKGQSLSLIHI